MGKSNAQIRDELIAKERAAARDAAFKGILNKKRWIENGSD